MDDGGVVPEQSLHPLGGEGGDGHHGVGPADGAPDEHALTDGPVAREAGGEVEDGQVVDGGHRGRPRSQGQVDVEAVDEVGRAEPEEAGHRPPDAVALTPEERLDPGGQLTGGGRMDGGGERGVDRSVHGRQQLPDVGAHPPARHRQGRAL